MLRPLTTLISPRLALEIGVHDQKPVHALRLRADQFDAPEIGKRRQRRVRRTADEIDRAVAQRRVGFIDRENQFERDIEPFGLEKPSSTAASAGKYEFEIMSGTASFMLGPPLRERCLSLYHNRPVADGDYRSRATISLRGQQIPRRIDRMTGRFSTIYALDDRPRWRG